MADAILTVCSPDRTWHVILNPQGTVLGRSPDCDVVIESPEVSRRHAEIFLASSQQWMLKDLGSSNGTFVNGTRIVSSTALTDAVARIGPVSLWLGEAPAPQAVRAAAPPEPKIIVEDFGMEVFYDKPRIEECPTPPCPERLANVKKRLSELTDWQVVCREVCRALAQGPGTAAGILRVPPSGTPLSSTPQVVAYHFGSSAEDTLAPSRSSRLPSPQGFRVSHRLLEAVRAKGRPLMTKSIFSCDTEITISLIDEHSPRALICTPVTVREDAIDLLYVDVPIDDRVARSPEEMFAFVQAVAQQAMAVRSAL